ncbi:MAG: hypothetical protein WDZ59_10155 [Pirellulales bacterium]
MNYDLFIEDSAGNLYSDYTAIRVDRPVPVPMVGDEIEIEDVGVVKVKSRRFCYLYDEESATLTMRATVKCG